MSQVFEILDTLKDIGVRVRVIPPETLRLEPASRIPPELLSRIRESKPEILEALRNRPAAPPKPDKPIECRYDWQSGYPGLRLHCVAHQHAVGTATVLRMPGRGLDVLLEMAELGILTGQALADSQRVQ